MNLYLLQFIGKWVGFIILSIVTSLGVNVEENRIEIINENVTKNISVFTEVKDYQIIKSYDLSIPNNISKVLIKGEYGLIFKNNNGDIIYEQRVINEEVVQGTGSYGIYNGILTGYGPDCSTCDGNGIVFCKTVDKNEYNLINDGIYYKDSEYGDVRVLAAALSFFPCGTIIEIKNTRLGDFTGIVMDTGYDMKKNLEKGQYHLDIAYETEQDEKIGRATDKSGNAIFSVQRWGW